MPVGVVAVVLAATVLRESRGGAVRLDPLGLVLSAAGMLLLVWGVVDGAGPRLDLGPGAVHADRRRACCSPRSSPGSAGRRRRCCRCGLFRSRGFSLVNVVTLTFSAGAFGSVFLLAQFFQVVQG